MSGEHTPGRLRPKPLTTLQWTQERLANTQRLAATKSGADRDGWLEDASYWKDIVSIIAAAPETAAERDRLRSLHDDLKEPFDRYCKAMQPQIGTAREIKENDARRRQAELDIVRVVTLALGLPAHTMEREDV